MEANSWRPAPGEPSGVDPGASGDWRSHLLPESRPRIVNKIMETLKKYLPINGPEGLSELQKIAVRFEEKIYAAATSQADYLRKISLKMLCMEKPQQPSQLNPAMTSASVMTPNPVDPAVGVQSQISNQGQSLPLPLINQSSAQQSLLSQSLHNNNTAPVHASADLPSALSSVTGLNQSISGVSHAPNLQSMPGMTQNSLSNSLGQGYPNAPRQTHGRQQQQQVIPQQQSQSQFPHLLKQKIQQNALLQPHIQQQQLQQQQSLLPAQLQSSQQSLLQSSSIPMGPSTVQQTQQASMQSASQPGLQHNQLNPIQQSVPSLLQQHQQSVARQPQQAQSNLHQQGSLQPSALQQQQLMAQPANIQNMQQAQLLGQQSNASDMQQQQQRLSVPQNNHMSMQQTRQMFNQQTMSLHSQQQLGSPNNMPGLQQQLQQQQQSQLLGNVSGIPNMQQHQRQMQMLQQPKTATQQLQAQQTSMASMQPQAQQSQLQQSSQHLISQFQSQPAQLQQQLTMPQQPNSLPHEFQQRLQASTALLQPQNATEQQKQYIVSQRVPQEVSSSTSMDSTGQTVHSGIADWQEEIYQKIKSMKDRYFPELTELYQKLSLKLQQLDSLGPPAKPSEQYEKLNNFKVMVERSLGFFQLSKSNIHISLKDKLPSYEKQIVIILASHKRKPVPAQGQQQYQGPAMQQQQSSQVMQLQQHDNHTNQLQHTNLQGNTTTIQSTSAPNMQHVAVPSSTNLGTQTAQQNIANSLQSGANLEPIQGNSFSSQQQSAMGSLQQGGVATKLNTMNGSQQAMANILPHSSLNNIQPAASSTQPNTNALQQHLKQQEQQHLMQQSQQIKQLQQRQMQQLLQQKQQMLQQQLPLQQQLHQQQKQQQAGQMGVPQMSQLHQVNEANDVKVRQGPGMKPGVQQNYSAGQRSSYFHSQMKPGGPFPIASPQSLQTSSPQILHHSPQIDQHSLLSSQIKAGTPLQSANSPFAPSPSTPIAPSPIPSDSEKPLSTISSLSNAGQIGHQQATVAPQAQLTVGTPGISASPLLAEFTSIDTNQANLQTQVSGKSSATERPLDRLIKAVLSATTQTLGSAVSDIGSVGSMIDRIAGSAPGNGSRAGVGEDLVAMTKCRLQARNFISQDGNASKKMKRDTSAMPLNIVSSVGGANDSFKQLCSLDMSELRPIATSCAQWDKVEVNHALLEEIQEINQQLINTVININKDDADSIAAASEDGEGTVIKCTFTAVALSPSFKSQIASAQMSPILPLRLLIPADYPKCSPILLDNLPDEQSDSDELSAKARSRFNMSLRALMQPMSLREMVRTWDACARKVIDEYAQQTGGGSFSSTYGTWENCVGA